jgi:hypothetical protein
MENAEKTIIVSYTEKSDTFTGFKSAQFFTRAEAETWIKDNEKLIYWSSIRIKNPVSHSPKRLLTDDVSLEEYTKIEGVLETYYETGLECLGLIIHNSAINGTVPNPKFDSTKPESSVNFKYFSSYEDMHFIESGDILQPEGGSRYLLIKDRQFAADDAYRLSFYPQGFTYQEWTALFSKQDIKATVWTKKKN